MSQTLYQTSLQQKPPPAPLAHSSPLLGTPSGPDWAPASPGSLPGLVLWSCHPPPKVWIVSAKLPTVEAIGTYGPEGGALEGSMTLTAKEEVQPTTGRETSQIKDPDWQFLMFQWSASTLKRDVGCK